MVEVGDGMDGHAEAFVPGPRAARYSRIAIGDWRGVEGADDLHVRMTAVPHDSDTTVIVFPAEGAQRHHDGDTTPELVAPIDPS